jgi:anion-transporting  ArsA/GET3 family ATPase
MSDTTTLHTLAAVVANADLVVTCGPGGVGKTTTAAAVGLAAARAGRRVVVVTIDPARRLADALGIVGDTDEPHLVAGATKGATRRGGSFSALMLDAERTFDRLVTERGGDRAEAVLANPIYRSIAGSLGGAQEYMAIERLHELVNSGDYDLVVLDTPPSRHAIDVLEAPDRLVRFLSHPIYRALTLPSRSFARVTNAATSAFLWTVKRLAGPSIVEDTVGFFRSISGMEAGLRERAEEMAALLRSNRAAFVLVSSPRAEAIDESTFMATTLQARGFELGAVVVNLVHPLIDELSVAVDADTISGPLAEQLAYHHELRHLALAERDEIEMLSAASGEVVLIEVPLLDHDVHDIAALTEVGALLGLG